jgi:hypothetical protein
MERWIILKWMLEVYGLMGWAELAQDIEQLRALVNTVMDLRAQSNVATF